MLNHISQINMSDESAEDILEYEAELENEMNIEYEIEREPAPAVAPTVAPIEEPLDRKLPKKDRLIASIEQFRPYMSEMVPTANKLKKTKIKDLERLLARCISVSSGLNMKAKYEEPEPQRKREAVVDEEPIPVVNGVKSGAETLYMANLGIISVIEQVSRQTSQYTGVEVANWSDDIKRDKEQLVNILEAVYLENSVLVKEYLSPTSVWALYMMSSGAAHLKPVGPV